MESVRRLFCKQKSVTPVTPFEPPANAFTVTEAETYFASSNPAIPNQNFASGNPEPTINDIRSFVEKQMSHCCPDYNLETLAFLNTTSVMVFRLACELNIPYWLHNDGDSKETLKELLSNERKLPDHMWETNPIDNHAFFTLGLHRGTALQLIISQEDESRKSLVKELTEVSGVEELRQVSISKCVDISGKRTFSTPLRDLIENYPKIAVTALNKSLHFCKQQDPQKEKKGVKLDMKVSYAILDDFSTVCRLRDNSDKSEKDKSSGGNSEEVATKSPHSPIRVRDFKIDCSTDRYDDSLENHTLRLISHSANSFLLNHPIVQLFVFHLWGRVKWAHYYQLLYFLLYLISLDVFVLGESSYMMSNNSNHTDGELSFPRASVFIELPSYVQCCLIITFLFCVCGFRNLVRRILFRLESAHGIEMLFEEISYVCVGSYCLYIVLQGFIFNPDSEAKKSVEPPIIILGALGCCVSWITFMLYCRVLNKFGLLIEIFRSIAMRFLYCMPVGILLLCGFGSSFAILFRNVPLFNSVHSTFIVAAQIVFAQITTNDVLDSADGYRNLHQQNAAYLITVYVFIFGFLVFAILTFVNMLTGLATDDVQKMMSEAEEKQYRQQLKMSIDFASYHQTTRNNGDFLVKATTKIAAFCRNNRTKTQKREDEKNLNRIISKAIETHMTTM